MSKDEAVSTGQSGKWFRTFTLRLTPELLAGLNRAAAIRTLENGKRISTHALIIETLTQLVAELAPEPDKKRSPSRNSR